MKLYEEALAAYESGDNAGAKSLLVKLLQKEPKSFEALNFLGVLAFENGETDEAKRLYQRSLRLNPRNAQTHNNLGNLYSKQALYDKAVECFSHAIALQPSFAKAYYNRATVLKEQEFFEQSIPDFLQALKLQPDMGAAYINLGLCYKQLRLPREAKECYEKALYIGGCVEEAAINLGVLAKDEGDVEEALLWYEKALGANPASFQAYNNIGVALQGLKRYDDSVRFFAQAISINPLYADAYINLGVSLMELDERSKAKGAFLKALSLDEKNPHAYINFGVFAKQDQDYETAKSAFAKALELSPSNSVAKTNLGVLLLMTGDYENGLQLYEHRELPTLECDKPLWAGEPLAGKTIVVYHEQGFGDTIQFARLLPRLAKMAGVVIFVPQSELLCVLDESALGVRMMSPQQFVQSSPSFDYHISLASLLLRFDVRADNLPTQFAYLKIDDTKSAALEQKMLCFADKKRVGFAWQGNPKHTGDKQRSAPLEAFAVLDRTCGVRLFCLQKEPDIEAFSDFAKTVDAVEFSSMLRDFGDTLALINTMDIVVCVDTSVAHLAATAGKTVWLLVAAVADWRWGTMAETSGWYDSVRLFRQQKNERWDATLARLCEKLLEVTI